MSTTTLILSILLSILLLACNEPPKPTAKNAQPAPVAVPGQFNIAEDSAQLKQIVTAGVEMSLVTTGTVSAPAKVEANVNRLSHVVLPLAGRVTSLSVRIGDFVKQGQALLTLESPDADAAVANHQQALAALTQTKSAMAKAQTGVVPKFETRD
jgi:membrane fusion protein, heavy metal efflux system